MSDFNFILFILKLCFIIRNKKQNCWIDDIFIQKDSFTQFLIKVKEWYARRDMIDGFRSGLLSMTGCGSTQITH